MLKNTKNSIVRLVFLCTLLCGLAFEGTTLADKVHLKDGTVIEGSITREVEGYVWMVVDYGGVEQKRLLRPDEIARVERTAGATPVEAKPSRPEATTDPVIRRSGAPRGVVLTLEGTVGLQMAAHALEQALPWLEENQIDIVVFKINSGGGYLLEIQELSDTIQNKFKPRFRCVAWIESAISAAAMTAHCLEEIYFMSEGNYGACTGWSGALQAVKGRGLEEVLYMMEKISARGGHDPQVMRAMQIMEPLSCTIDENGDVKWYQNLEGEIIVNPDERILTFDHQMARRVKFSKGTADTLDQLTNAMQYDEVEWVGKWQDGGLFPISKAEEIQLAYRNNVDDVEVRLNEFFTKYQMAVGNAAGSQDRQTRGAFVAKARRYLHRIVQMIKTNPKFSVLIVGATEQQWEDYVEEQEQMLRDLMR